MEEDLVNPQGRVYTFYNSSEDGKRVFSIEQNLKNNHSQSNPKPNCFLKVGENNRYLCNQS